jgi:hypothetical protein
MSLPPVAVWEYDYAPERASGSARHCLFSATGLAGFPRASLSEILNEKGFLEGAPVRVLPLICSRDNRVPPQRHVALGLHLH